PQRIRRIHSEFAVARDSYMCPARSEGRGEHALHCGPAGSVRAGRDGPAARRPPAGRLMTARSRRHGVP
ncbi:hypothetical protein AB0M79_23930, partial [Polymorphospora sp. NPDC051019]|uniref:hypothetical protein n=1 Tax=Polymorphospora sp. NPDC051019 TaxID=3155725 RepID=UPI00342AEB14